MTRLLVLVLWMILAPNMASAATYAAATCSQADVSTAYGMAVDGDTVTVPSGTCSWATGLTLSHAITLQGAGTGSTVIRDGLASGELLTINLVPGKATRMTAIEFNNNAAAQSFTGAIHIFGSLTANTTMRIDHCKFDHLNGVAIWPDDVNYGVFDHNTWLIASNKYALYARIGTYGYTDIDTIWATAAGWGGSNFLFIEDNTVTEDAGSFSALFDAYGGARLVYRHNTLTNGWIEAHGTESASRSRGTRAMEVYSNTFTTDTTGFGGIVNVRSGGVLIHDNTATGYASPNLAAQLNNERTIAYFTPWNQGDGTDPWDSNSAVLGTQTSTSASGLTVTVSGAAWTTNQYANYMIKRTSGCTQGASVTCAAIIASNTATTITFHDAGGYPSGNLAFTGGGGDAFVINRITQVLDAPCRGQGTNLGGVTTPSVPMAWNDQVTEPCYEWSNTHDGGSNMDMTAGNYADQTRVGEHFFNDTSAPGYTPYTYPHPLVTCGQLTCTTPGGFRFSRVPGQ